MLLEVGDGLLQSAAGGVEVTQLHCASTTGAGAAPQRTIAAHPTSHHPMSHPCGMVCHAIVDTRCCSASTARGSTPCMQSHERMPPPQLSSAPCDLVTCCGFTVQHNGVTVEHLEGPPPAWSSSCNVNCNGVHGKGRCPQLHAFQPAALACVESKGGVPPKMPIMCACNKATIYFGMLNRDLARPGPRGISSPRYDTNQSPCAMCKAPHFAHQQHSHEHAQQAQPATNDMIWQCYLRIMAACSGGLSQGVRAQLERQGKH
jgi:hypothetical protein